MRGVMRPPKRKRIAAKAGRAKKAISGQEITAARSVWARQAINAHLLLERLAIRVDEFRVFDLPRAVWAAPDARGGRPCVGKALLGG